MQIFGELTMKSEIFAKSYWLVEDKILAGPYPYNPGAEKPLEFLHFLKAEGIDSFVDLTEEDELTPYFKHLDDSIHYHRFPIEDYSICSHELMRTIQDHLKSELAAGRKIYLHCFGGIGRTGTVAGVFLVESGHTGVEALQELALLFKSSSNSAWTTAPETIEQRKMVENWKKSA